MEEKSQTQLYSEFLTTKAKKLDIDPELKEKIIAMLTYLSSGDKLYLNQEFQSEYYLQIIDNQLLQTSRNHDSYGTLMQRNTAIMLVKNLPEIYLTYKDKIEESLSKGKRF